MNVPLQLSAILSKKILIPLIILALLIIAAVPSIYFYKQYKDTQNTLKNPDSINKKEVKEIVGKVGKLIELPSEAPTLATVFDITKLKDQPFFTKAKNGDKVLIYTEAKKAVLYRPSTNKIIEVSNVDLGNNPTNFPTTKTSPSPTAEAKITVALYNGTTTVGLTKTTQDSLAGKFDNIEIVARENASKSDYTKTIVIDLSGKNEATADALAGELKGEVVVELPEGETKPDEGDILIILGTSSN